MKLPYLDEPFPVFPGVTVEAWTAFSSLGVDEEPQEEIAEDCVVACPDNPRKDGMKVPFTEYGGWVFA